MSVYRMNPIKRPGGCILRKGALCRVLTLLHSEQPKLYRVLDFLSAIELSVVNQHYQNTANKQYKDEGYTFRRNNSIISPLLSRGLLLKERNCSSRSKFFLLRVDPIQRRPFPEIQNMNTGEAL